MAQLGRNVPGPWDVALSVRQRSKTDQEIAREESIALNKLLNSSDNLPDGTIKGFVLRIPFENSFVYYRVRYVKPLTLDPIYFMGGRGMLSEKELAKINLRQIIQYQEAYRAMFLGR